MMGLKDRLARIESKGGGRRCTCGFFGVSVNGEFHRASRHGVPILEEAYRDYVADKVDGVCGRCGGTTPAPIVVGGNAPRRKVQEERSI